MRSSPAGAKVLEGDEALGETPLRIQVDPVRVRRLKLLKEGYAAFIVAVDPGMKEAPTVTLLPSRPAPADPKPKRRSPSRGKGKRRGKGKSKAGQPAKGPKPERPSGGGLLYDDALK